jgi:hypothetical protein
LLDVGGQAGHHRHQILSASRLRESDLRRHAGRVGGKLRRDATGSYGQKAKQKDFEEHVHFDLLVKFE